MNAGIPYITNSRPEASKIISENNCGFIFDDQTPESIGQQFNEVIKEDLKSYGQNGRNAVEKKFIWKKDFELFFKQLA